MRSLGVVAVSMLIVAACSAAPTAAPTPAPSPTSIPTPSPTPFDLSKAFLTKLSLASSAETSLSGTMEIGSQSATISGTSTTVGADSDQTLTLDFPTIRQVSSHVTKAGLGYTKTGDGPWLQDEQRPQSSKNLGAMLRAIESVTDAGTETKAGRLLHRLEIPAATVIDPADLGFTDPSITDPKVNLVFYAADDGTPVVMTMSATWTHASGATTVPVKLTIDFDFQQLGGALTVNVPEPVWQRFTSARFAYKIAYPVGWQADTSNKDYDVLVGSGQEVGLLRDREPSGATLKAVVSREIAATYNPAGLTLDANEAYTVDREQARLLTLHGVVSGTKLVIYGLITLTGEYGYFVTWNSTPADADKALFEQMLSTFRFDRNVWGLQRGDCFTSAPIGGAAGELGLFVGGVDDFAQVGCTGSHTGEVMAVLGPKTTQDCRAIFAEYVGRPLSGSKLIAFTFLPVSLDIPPAGVTGLCVVANPSGRSTGSVAGSGQ